MGGRLKRCRRPLAIAAAPDVKLAACTKLQPTGAVNRDQFQLQYQVFTW